MLSVRLDPAVERRLEKLARRTGRTKTYYNAELLEPIRPGSSVNTPDRTQTFQNGIH
jgi:predicted transcriptional regulator